MTIDKKTTHQLETWRGEFGDSYTGRNIADAEMMGARTKMWAELLRPIAGDPPVSILEVGANLGINLRALKHLTDAHLTALEPNASARKRLIDDKVVEPSDVHDAFASEIPLPDAAVDLVFTCGVMIHIAPDDLLASCREIHRISKKYLVCCEYFSVSPEEIPYRGQDGLLFKRDFGDFWMSNFTDLKLVDYGFFWKRVTGLDNLTWWLFSKQ